MLYELWYMLVEGWYTNQFMPQINSQPEPRAVHRPVNMVLPLPGAAVRLWWAPAGKGLTASGSPSWTNNLRRFGESLSFLLLPGRRGKEAGENGKTYKKKSKATPGLRRKWAHHQHQLLLVKTSGLCLHPVLAHILEEDFSVDCKIQRDTEGVTPTWGADNRLRAAFFYNI